MSGSSLSKLDVEEGLSPCLLRSETGPSLDRRERDRELGSLSLSFYSVVGKKVSRVLSLPPGCAGRNGVRRFRLISLFFSPSSWAGSLLPNKCEGAG